MAKGNSRKKGKGKSKGRKSRKSKAKSRYASLVRKHGKERAHEMTFGPRKGKHRKGKGKGKHKGKKGRKGHSRRNHNYKVGKRSQEFVALLREIQANEGTTGLPASAQERRMAEQIFESLVSHSRSTPQSEAQKLKAKFSAEKRALVKKMAAEKLRAAEREYKAELKARAEKDAENDLANAL